VESEKSNQNINPMVVTGNSAMMGSNVNGNTGHTVNNVTPLIIPGLRNELIGGQGNNGDVGTGII
jgi:hypothetical protein